MLEAAATGAKDGSAAARAAGTPPPRGAPGSTPSWEHPPFKDENRWGIKRAETTKIPRRPRALSYLRPSFAPAGRALQLQPPDSSVRSRCPARRSWVLRGPKVRQWQRLEPGRPAPERGASSRPERTNEPGPPSSAPDSGHLSSPSGGAAYASHRLPAFSISLSLRKQKEMWGSQSPRAGKFRPPSPLVCPQGARAELKAK